jgi:hypothetical protein
MKWLLAISTATLVGCVSTSPDPQTPARRHADNVRTAEKDGYQIVARNGGTLFCASGAPLGSHIVPACEREAEWEKNQLWVGRGGAAWPGLNTQSGRGPTEGTLGY